MADATRVPEDRLRVLFITAWHPTARRPAVGVFVREHARAVQQYADVVVLHCAGADLLARGLWRVWREDDPALTAGIPTYRVAHRDLAIPGVTSLSYIWSAIRAAGEVAAEGFEPDIIHAHIYEAGVPAVLFGRRRRIPVIITEHSSDFPRRRLPPLQVLKARFAFARAERVLPVSQALKRSIEQHGISSRFTVVPNAVDTDLFRPLPELHRPAAPHRLLYVGSLIPVKGLDLLLRALGKLRSLREDWHLDVMGDGSERAAYRALSEELGLHGCVTFRGQGSKTDVAGLMAHADLLVVPSRWDNAPCVIIEAMACGLPVLATRVGGIPELVTDEIGALVPGEDVDQLAAGVDAMLHTLPRIDRRIIRQRAERYSLSSVGNDLRMIYEEVIAQRSAADPARAGRQPVAGTSDVRQEPGP